ncbi:Protein ESSENTIAL FOR POTEXVIRUS ACCUMULATION 1 [Linum grandiflorum]
MAERKLDLSDDLLSSKQSDHSAHPKGLAGIDVNKFHSGSQDDSKDQLAADSTIPLSPQWLYAKPSDAKMDVRSPTAVSQAAVDPGQKDTWRLDGTEDRKDWRRIANENESNRRWREEERETGLLGARRERRKVDRRVDAVREGTDNKPVASSERWNDGGNRNAATETRRDNKWSSRWGPEDKDKDSRIEKKTDLEKEKNDTNNDNQASIGNNRIAPERESDSRDKWRPRHRMEVHSSGPSSYRAAPGFGPERGRVEGSNTGFAVGRGRSSAAGRGVSIGAIPPTPSYISETFIGKPAMSIGTFCYPRGKLLDIYRRQKLDLSFGNMPEKMEESPPFTQVSCTGPLALVTPDADEESVLTDILVGKITSSGVAYNASKKEILNENSSGLDKDNSGQEVEGRRVTDVVRSVGVNGIETDSRVDQHDQFVQEIEANLPDDPSSLFIIPSFEKNTASNGKESGIPPEDLYFCYIDPEGNTQGPFLGADIVMWFEEGYFGTDLPVRLADAPEGTPFKHLGDVIPQLKYTEASGTEQPVTMGNGTSEFEASLSITSGPETTQLAMKTDGKIEDPSKLASTNAQNFHDLSVQDEGRPGSTGLPHVASSGSLRLPGSNSHPSLASQLTDPGLTNQTDSKLHPFGLFWSELEGSTARQPEVQVSAPEKWSSVYRQDSVSGPNMLQDSITNQRFSHLEQEHNQAGLAEQLMSSRQIQQQNILSPHTLMNESLMERGPSQNLIHQQLMGHSTPDMEHILALQLQQQRQLQRQDRQQQLQQQFQQQQQLQQQQQQKILQERQQSQVRQVLLEQLLHGQVPDRVDHIRANSILEQVILEQQLQQELQQRPHPSRHFHPSMEHHLAQAKLGQTMQQEQQRDLFELLSRAQHGQIQNLEQQFLRQEQIQAMQLAMGLRPQTNMEEERLHDSMWPMNENDQFMRSLSANQRNHSSGMNPLDLYQRQQMQRHEEQQQLSHLDRTISFQDRLRQGLFETGAATPFERSISMPPGASGMNMDVVNAIHRSELPEFNSRAQSSHLGAFSSVSQNPHHPNQFNVGRLQESNGQLPNDWMESRMQQMQINAERKKREAEVKMAAENPSLWMSDGMNEDKSRQLLMELLHHNSGHQSADALHMPFDRTSQSSHHSASTASDLAYIVGADQDPSLNNSFAIGSYGSNNARETADLIAAENHAIGMDGSAKWHGRRTYSGIGDVPQGPQGAAAAYPDRNMMRGSFLDIQDGMGATDHIEMPINPLSRHSSMGGIGFYDDSVGQRPDEMHLNQISAPKQQEPVLLRRPPSSRSSSSHEGGLSSIDVNSANQSSDKRFRRTSSYGDSEVSEPSFIDMLKSNSRKGGGGPEMAMQQGTGIEAMESGQVGKSGKKKGKKGKQIDPALLGFKVTSNRIMMGEIQRFDD